MKLTIDEQVLTAYALDELPIQQRFEVKAYLATHPDAAAEVEAIRAMAGQLTAELAAEAVTFGSIKKPVVAESPMKIRRSRRVEAMLAIAASVALVGGSVTVLIGAMSGPRIDRFATTHNPTAITDVNVLIQSVREMNKQGQYKQAAGAIDRILEIDPKNEYALGAKPLLDDRANLAEQQRYRDMFNSALTKQLNSAEEKKIPYDEILRYPAGWNAPSAVSQSANPNAPKPQDKFVSTKGESKTPSFQNTPLGGANRDSINSSPTKPGQSSTTVTRTYDIRDLVVDIPDFSDAPNFNLDSQASGSGGIAQGGQSLFKSSVKPTDGKQASGSVHGKSIVRGEDANSGGQRYEPGSIANIGVAVDPAKAPLADREHNTESYDRIVDNAFLNAEQNPLSTFSIDVDTASYSNLRRFLTQGQLPPKDAVRIEEMVNYFPYRYEGPKDGDKPFAASVEVAGCPWSPSHRLVRVAIKGKEIAPKDRPASNLVFLIDVSGSMNDPNKLPLVKESMRKLVNKLDARDRVAMVVYAGNSGLVLPSTQVGGVTDKEVGDLWRREFEPQLVPDPNGEKPLNEDSVRAQFVEAVARMKANRGGGRQAILDAIDRLESGGSTNGGAGIELAYLTAQSGFIKDGVNRVILATDGDFNVGVTDQGSLTRLIEEKAKGGTFLSVLGFGMGNTKDSTMEKLADKGNGNYAYIDTAKEAQKVLVEQMSGTLVTIAKDVKIQVEFNPSKVGSYRLIGYENRILAKEDFNDDKKDAGEIGAGHTVTALYEVEPPTAKPSALPTVDPLKYQHQPVVNREVPKDQSNDLLTLKIRYKAPDAPLEQGTSKLLKFPITDDGKGYEKASEDFKFAAAVASFGMILRGSEYKGTSSYDAAIEMAMEGKGLDANGYRAELIELIKKAKATSNH